MATIITGGGNDNVSGTDDLDIILTGGGNDTIQARRGDDQIFAGSGADRVDAGEGADEVSAGDGDDIVDGGDDADTIEGDSGADTLLGGSGDDFIDAGTGRDLVFGGAGNDNIDATSGNGAAGNADRIYGDGFSSYADFLAGAPPTAAPGDDTILAGEASDIIYGDHGANGTAGGNDSIFGGGGADTIFGEGGNDFLSGQDGRDTIDAGDGDDVVSGGAGADTIDGGAGDDTIFGDDGDDTIDGGAGDDTIDGGEGDDIIAGGAGDDAIAGDDANDIIDGGEGDDTISGGENADTLVGGSGNDDLSGDDGTDKIDGGTGEDTISGGEGRDTLAGGSGNDTLSGDAGNDTIDGGAGDDVISGGAGADTLTGGGGIDRFVINPGDSTAGASDVITDFVAGVDEIDLSAITSGSGTFGGTIPTAGGVWYQQVGGQTRIFVDVTGDGVADLRLALAGALTLNAADFVGVAGGGSPPVTTNDTTTVGEDGVVFATGNVLANDTGSGVAVSAVRFGATTGTVGVALAGTYGSLLLGANGAYSYTLDNSAANVQGLGQGESVEDVFSYTASNADGSATASLVVSITGANDAPTASAMVVATNEDVSLIGALAAADDVDGDTVTYALGTQAANGVASVNADGSFSYAPHANFNGSDSFVYTVTDANGGSSSYAVGVTVAPVNDAPVSSATSLVTEEDAALSGNLPGATDVENDAVTYAVATPAANGTAVVNPDGSFSYTPNANFSGSDSFAFAVSDRNDGTTYGVSLTVTPVNDAPTSSTAAFATDEDMPLSDTLPTAIDVDGDSATYALDAAAANGAAVVNADGTFTYTPNSNFNGDDSFSFTVSDGNGGGNTYAVAVAVASVNDAPIATGGITLPRVIADEPFERPLPSGVFADVDGDALNLVVTMADDSPLPTWLTFSGSTLTGVAPSGAADLALRVTAVDPDGESVSVTTVLAVNERPVSSDASVTTAENAVLNGTLPQATDPDADTVTYALDTPAEHGVVVVNTDGTFSYTPGASLASTDSFTFTVTDTHGGSNAYAVAVEITGPNRAPLVASADVPPGIVTTTLGFRQSDDFARSVLTQPDGKILVAGYTYDSEGTADFALVRYNTDGSLDTTFGGGDGIAAGDFVPDTYIVGLSMATQLDGKILVAGHGNVSTGGGLRVKKTAGAGPGLVLVRYNADGSVDAAFGSNGVTAPDIVPESRGGTGYSVTTQADGKILVGGYIRNATGDSDFSLVRLNVDASVDGSFGGGDGIVTTNFGIDASYEAGYSVTLQPDGKILVAGVANTAAGGGDFALVRYNTDGSLDATFGGGDGIVTTDFNASGSYEEGYSVVVQLDGKILVGGQAQSSTGQPDFALVRYNADGSIDPTFGGGDGIVVTNFGTDATYEVGYSVTLQLDGKILVAGTASTSDGGADFVVVRYNADGSLDSTFGSDGIVTTNFGPDASYEEGYSVTVQSDGKILVAGHTFGSTGGYDFAVVRYNADGSLDTDFRNRDERLIATEGSPFTYTVPTDKFEDPDGDPLTYSLGAVDGTPFPAWLEFDAVTRTFTGTPPAGAPDAAVRVVAIDPGGLSTSYTYWINTNNAPALAGVVLTTLRGYPQNAMVVQPDGKVVVAGSLYSPGGRTDFGLVRYNADGSLDTLFAGDGIARTNFGPGSTEEQALALAIQVDGKFLVAGHARSLTGAYDLALVRYDTDGSVDTSFGGADGIVTTSVGAAFDTEVAYSVTAQSDGKILVGGYSSAFAEDFVLVRYNADGSLDTAFGGGDGIVTTNLGPGTSEERGRSIVSQPDGKILVGGYTRTSTGYDFALVRYNADGSVDSSFGGGDGIVTTSFAPGVSYELGYSITTQADGKILLAGYSDTSGDGAPDFALVRYNVDGSLDTSFDGDGIVITNFGLGATTEYAYSVTTQPDGKILVAGYANASAAKKATKVGSIGLVRYNSDGSLDTSFGGGDGIVTSDLFGAGQGLTVAAQVDGKILVSGPSASIGTFAVARFNADGSPDTTFGGLAMSPINAGIFGVSVPTGVFADPEGDTLTYAVTMADGSALPSWLETSGNYLNGTAPIGAADLALRLTATDTFGLSSSLPFTLSFNDAPTASAVSISTRTGTILAGVLPAAVDADGDDFAYELSTHAANGTAIVNGDGSFTYMPNAGFTGSDSFLFAVRDSFGAANTYAVSVSVDVINAAPTSSDASVSTNEDTPLNGHLPPANDANGDAITYTLGAQATRGTAIVNTDGSFSYAPNANFNGSDSFSFAVSDGNGGSNTYDVGVTVTSVNDAPTASDASLTTSEDTPISASLPDPIEVDGDLVTYALSSEATNGIAVVNADGTFTYTPSAEFAGEDTFTYLVHDSAGSSNVYNISITVTAENDAPVAAGFGLPAGVVTTGSSTRIEVGRSVALQPDGRLVVAGWSYTDSGQAIVTLFRYNADGSIDTTFGGDGIATGSFGDGYELIIQADGKILVAGAALAGGSDFALLRFNGDGSLDTTFDSDGVVTTAVGAHADGGHSATLQLDGKIVVAGFSATASGNIDVALARYNSDGSIDTTFGAGDGTVTTTVGSGNYAIGYGVITQPDGRIVVAGVSYVSGQSSSDFALIRYTADGSLDPSFGGTSGIVITNVGSGASFDSIRSVTNQPDGKIVVAGHAFGPNGYDFALARYSTDGVLDTSFGAGGIVTTPIANGMNADVGYDVTVQSDGRILVTGYSSSATVGIALVRYNTDGSLDTMFGGGDGIVLTGVRSSAIGQSVITQPDGKIVVAGYSTEQSHAGDDLDVVIARYNADGSLDASFSPIGSPAATTGAPFSWTLPPNLFFDIDGDSITYSITHGDGSALPSWLTFDGTVLSGIAPNGTSDLALRVAATDPFGASASIPFLLAIEHAPVASSAAVVVDEDTVLEDNLPAATDADGDPVAYALGNQGAHGTAVVDSDGTYSYTPNANFNGGDAFSFTVSDARGGSNTYTANVTVVPVNDAPTSSTFAVSTDEDTVVSGTLPAAVDVDGDTVTYALASAAANGVAVVNGDGTFTYTPNSAYSGTDAFSFSVSDVNGGSNTYAVTVNIGATNDPPVAADAAITTAEDTPLNGALPIATDADGDTVTYALGTNAANGLAVVNADGTYSYTPKANFNGNDGFTFTVSDPNGGTNTYDVAVNVTPVNDAPTSTAHAFTATEDTPLAGDLPSATDVDGDAVAYELASTAGNGLALVNADGTFTYTPNTNFHGSDSFTFTVSDANGGSNTYAVDVTVTPVNDAPTASGMTVATNEDTALNGTLPAAADAENDAITYNIATNPTNGAAVVNSDGTYSYIPNANFNGTDSFSFEVRDPSTAGNTYTVDVVIGAANDAPVAASMTVGTAEDTVLTGSLPTAIDVDGDTVTYSLHTPAEHGVAVVNADGAYSYTPNADFNGTDAFEFTVSDAAGGTNTYEVTAIVASLNDAPVSSAAAFATNEDTELSGTLPPATDVDGDTVTYALATQAANGTAAVNNDGSFSYTPNANFSGNDRFSFVVRDGNGGSNSYDVDVAVGSTNQAPFVANSGTPAGIVTTAIAAGLGADTARAVLVQPDGKIVAAGIGTTATGGQDFALVRYNADGTLDTTFGSAGVVTTAIGSGSAPDNALSAALQPDGKIVVSGFATTTAGGQDFALVRYNADGSLDTTFGGTGIVTTAVTAGAINEQGWRVVVQLDGKLLLTGFTQTSAGGPDFGLIRYNADGSLDTTFGDGDGIVTTAIGPGTSSDGSYSVAIQSDGKIVVSGVAGLAPGLDLGLVRYNSDGSLDTSFGGGDGIVTTAIGDSVDLEFGTSVMVQADDKILVAGLAQSFVVSPTFGGGVASLSDDIDFALVRYNADGSLDTSFGGDGIVTTNLGLFDQTWSATLQADGKILVAGTTTTFSGSADFVLIRYNVDGSLDTSFGGGDGSVVTAISAGTGRDFGFSVTAQTDGKIIVAGTSFTPSGGGDFTVVRYNADGSLDGSFRAQEERLNPTEGALFTYTVPADRFTDPDGDTLTYAATQADGSPLPAWLTFEAATRTFSGTPPSGSPDFNVRLTATDPSGLSASYAYAIHTNVAPTRAGIVVGDIGGGADSGNNVIALADGKLLVTGSGTTAAGGSDFALMRYNADGSVDTSFGGDGVVATAIGQGNGSDSAAGAAVQSDGKIVVAGQATTPTGGIDLAVVRYNADGSLDTSFGGGDGVVTMAIGSGTATDQASAVAIQADGKIIASGTAMVRFNVDGSLDTSFGGGDGIAVGGGLGLTLLPDGKIVTVSSVSGQISGSLDFAISRFNADGSPDTAFGAGGSVVTPIGPIGAGDIPFSVVVQTDGRLIVAGVSSTGTSSGLDFALVRYNTDGSLDTSFGGGDGIVTTPIGPAASQDWGRSIALQSDGKIVVAGFATTTAGGQDLALARYNSDGSLDTTFGGGDGIVTTAVGTGTSTDSGFSVAVQADGKIVVTGATQFSLVGNNVAVVRYNADGSLDTTFGGLHLPHVVAGTAFTLNLPVTLFSDPEGDPLAIDVSMADGSPLPAWLNLSNTFMFGTPPAGSPDLALRLFAMDASGAEISLPFALIIDNAPTAGATSVSIPEDMLLNGVLPLATDADGDAVTYSLGTPTTNGAVVVNLDGTYSYAPNGNFNGSDAFTYTVRDTTGLSNTYTVNVTVTPVNDAPAAAVVAGAVTTSLSAAGTNIFGQSVTTQPDGKILVAGGATTAASGTDFALMRYNANGSLDSSFGGGDGIVTTAIGAGTANDTANTVLASADGKIVTAGYSAIAGGPHDFVVARYNADGSLDTTFGGGDGIVTTGVGPATGVFAFEGYSAVAQPDGKIVVGGSALVAANSHDYALVRYNADGSLDTSFGGGDGIVTTTLAGALGGTIARQADGKILLVGQAAVAGTADFALLRYQIDGSLDTSFGGGDGIVTTNIDGATSADVAQSVTVQSDGKIIVVGNRALTGAPNFFDSLDVAVVRYNADGSLDTTFGGGDGIVITDIAGRLDLPGSVKVQQDGKVIVGGVATTAAGGQDFALLRYNADGTLDATFGGGDGITTVALAAGAASDFGQEIALQSDGKILLTGSSGTNIGLVRFNADGTLDSTFGDLGLPQVHTGTAFSWSVPAAAFTDADGDALTYAVTMADGSALPSWLAFSSTTLSGTAPAGSPDLALQLTATDAAGSSAAIPFVLAINDAPTLSGIVTTAIGTGEDVARTIVVGPDGKILVGGWGASSASGVDFALLRYNADGSLDTTFGRGDGIVTTPIGPGTTFDASYGLAVQADGRILLAGSGGGTDSFGGASIGLVRYNANGSLDTTFGGGDGIVTTAIPPVEGLDAALEVIAQSDGRILVSGWARDGADQGFAVLRYNADGSLDTTFGGGDGIVVTAFPGLESSFGLAVLADGRIIAGGASAGDFALVRFNADGTLDTSFGNGGLVTTDIAGPSDSSLGLTMLAGGKFLLMGSTITTGTPDIALARYNADGSVDTTFGDGDGIVIKDIGGAGDFSFQASEFPDGRLLVSGLGATASGGFDVVVLRYNADGSPDTTFGGGDGIVTTAISTGTGVDWGFHHELLSDGRFVVVGRATSAAGDADIAVLRYNADGSLDTTFGGFTLPKVNAGTAFTLALPRSVFSDPDGDALAYSVTMADGSALPAWLAFDGTTLSGTPPLGAADLAVRLTATDPAGASATVPFALAINNAPIAVAVSGAVVTSASAAGTAIFGQSIATQLDGKVLVAGGVATTTAGNDLALVRYNANGSLDSSFGGGDGIVTTAIGAGTAGDIANAVLAMPDGTIVVAGSSVIPSGPHDFVVSRYLADGSLDTTFGGGDGIVTTRVGSGTVGFNFEGQAAFAQPDGKIVVGGSMLTATNNNDFAVVRYNADGSLDTTFGGGDGIVTTALLATDWGTSIVRQSDGKILLTGTGSVTTINSDFALLRYNVDGSPDTTFGGGDGIVTTNIDGATSVDAGQSVTLQSDGKIIVVGNRFLSGATPTPFDTLDVVVVRYNPDGSLDTSFGGGDGIVITDIAGRRDLPATVKVQTDGKILVGGLATGPTTGEFLLLRYNPDGTLDAAFGGGDGIARVALSPVSNFGQELVLQSDGKILLTGSAGASIGLLRFNADGTLDSTFGNLGVPQVHTGTAFIWNVPATAFTDADGDTLTYALTVSSGSPLPAWLAFDGTTLSGTPPVGTADLALTITATDPSGSSAAIPFVLAINEAPTLSGIVTTAIGAGTTSDSGVGAALQPDGKLVASGRTTTSTGGLDWTVVRYNADGSLDTSFGDGGIVIQSLSTSTDIGFGVALQPDGRIVTVGGIGTTIQDVAVVRYNADGSLDTSFGDGDGIVTTTISATAQDQGQAVAIQADGKIVVAGYHLQTGAGVVLARYNVDGTLDASFGGGDGLAPITVGPNVGQPLSLAIQPDGKLVFVGGTAGEGTGNIDALIGRVNGDGSPDTTFGGGDGSTATSINTGLDILFAVQVLADGRILAAGQMTDAVSSTDVLLLRYNANGTLDTTFGGGDGIVTTAISTGTDFGRGLAVQADGKILVAGSGTTTAGGLDVVVLRYDADGTLDTTFSGDGIVTTSIGTGTVGDGSAAVHLQADGKIVVFGAGTTAYGGDFAVVRYNPDGSLDTTFGGLALPRVNSGVAFSLTMPPSVFSDSEGDALTYSVTMADGSALPAWLSFAGTTLSGTAPAEAPDVALRLTATDVYGLSANVEFSLAINDAPADIGLIVPAPPDTALPTTIATVVPLDEGTFGVPSGSLTVAVVNGAPFAIVGSQLSATMPLAAGATGTIVLRATDQYGATFDRTLDVITGDAGANAALPAGGAADSVLEGDDIIYGLGGDDSMFGGAGRDYLFGQDGADSLFGGGGNDRLNGGGGNDTLTGDADNDLLTGGAGADTFAFADGFGADLISDFGAGAASDDLIDLSGVANPDWTSFADVQAAMAQVGADTVIDLGDGNMITLIGVNAANLTAADFAL